MYVSCVHTSAAAVTIVDVAVIVATTAAAIDTAYRKSKMIKFQLLYNGGNLLISGTSGPRKPGRGSLSSGPVSVGLQVRVGGRSRSSVGRYPALISQRTAPAGKRPYFFKMMDTFLQIIQNIRQNMTEYIHTLMHIYSRHMFVLFFYYLQRL